MAVLRDIIEGIKSIVSYTMHREHHGSLSRIYTVSRDRWIEATASASETSCPSNPRCRLRYLYCAPGGLISGSAPRCNLGGGVECVVVRA